ncbi:hypothetical protein H1Q63_13935 [Desmonostoc muscorum CCALA 125]|nr:hypothetical protein [Desmonostoc muscorum CCALA 125]
MWQPLFISKLYPEDCCHLNGLALRNEPIHDVSLCGRVGLIDKTRPTFLIAKRHLAYTPSFLACFVSPPANEYVCLENRTR